MIVTRISAARIIGSFTPADVAEWRHGWRIVAGAAAGMGTGVALYLLVMSLFVVHLTKEFGWTRGDLGVAGMVAFVTGAIGLPTIGRLLDRFGFRRIVLVCVPALSVLYVMIALQPGRYAYHLALMVWGGLFGGGTAAIVYTRPVIAAFQRQRGLALGVATAGTSIAAMIVPPLLATIIVAYGWRAGLYTMSAITAVIGLPMALTLIGHARETAARPADEATGSVLRGSNLFPERDVTLGEAVRGARFWLLVGALAAVNIPGSGVVAQLAPLIGDKGLSEESAAFVLSIYAAGVLTGRLIAGFSLDRFQAPTIAALMTFVPAVGIALLLIPSSSFALAAVAVAMIGMQQGSEIDLIAYFVSRGFGLKHYGTIYGAVAIAGALSTAASLVFFGRVHDLTGSYDIALTAGSIAFCVGAAAFAAIGFVRSPTSAASS
jgi:MFS family permease